MTGLATPPQPRQLAPLDVFVLWIGDERIGWTRDHHIGFTGFVDASTAGAAAWVAHVALARRRDRQGTTAPAMSDVPTLSVALSHDDEWIWGGGQALARLIRPGTPTPAFDDLDVDDPRRAWWSIEVALPALASELDVTSAAYVIHRGLRGSGLAWEALDAFRGRADVSSVWHPAPPARAARRAERAERAATKPAREWRRRLAFAWSNSAVGRAFHS
jgi:hypothetical protein